MQLDAPRADRLAVQLGPDRERLTEATRAAAEVEQGLAVAPLAHLLDSGRRLERADQHGLGIASVCAADDVEHPVHAVAEVDLSLIHISEPTRRTPISYAVFCLK